MTRRSLTALAALALAVPVLAGCSSEKALTVEEAGERYLEIIEPGNELLNEYNQAVRSDDDAAVREAAGKLATSFETMVEELDEEEWPEEVAEPIDELEDELEKEIPAWQAVADAEDAEATDAAIAELPPVGPASEKIRSALGLDSQG